ncbi:MAG: hypothetical protein JXQ73_06290 [Phycisphaerae bacterium]|nr:hypothetical protein [Phycisphaerae bacterium]
MTIHACLRQTSRTWHAAILVLALSAPVGAATLNVGSGQTYTTIADAIAAAGDATGDVINVVDAVHTEQGIVVDKSVTIRGQGIDATIVQAHADPNTARDRVFAISAGVTVTIKDMTIRHGHLIAFIVQGGGILNEGTLSLTNVDVTTNYARGGPNQSGHGSSEGHGGGVYNTGTMTITGGSVRDNIAWGGSYMGGYSAYGGGIYNVGNLTITGAVIGGNLARGATGAYSGADGSGGAIYNGGSTTAIDTTFENNTAEGGRCGVSYAYGGDGRGGAIANKASYAVTLHKCTLSGNVARGGEATVPENRGESYGGGAATSEDGTGAELLLVNCTISGNIAFHGGGVWAHSGASLTQCTVTDNLAVLGGGVCSNTADDNTGPALAGTIVAGNIAVSSGADVYQNVQSRGYNLIEDAAYATVDVDGGGSTGLGNIIGQDPLLGPLADNGGATLTHALLSDSPAIDQIPEGINGLGTAPLDVDQRGVSRLDHWLGDIGAYEADINPGIAAAMTAALEVDKDNDGKADPGERLRYTVVVTNSGDQPAAGVIFRAWPGQHTSLKVGTVVANDGLIRRGNAEGNTYVRVDFEQVSIGDSVTITFDTKIDAPVPAGVFEVSAHGTVSGDNFNDVDSDDLDTKAKNDPTVTPLHTCKLTVTGGTGSGTYLDEETVAIEATVPDGARFDGWTGDTKHIADVTAPSTTVTLKSDTKLTATSVDRYSLTVNTEGQGEVTTDPNDGAYDDGAEVSITATASDAWQFVQWTGDVPDEQAGDNPLTLTMDQDRTITAVFGEFDPASAPAPTACCGSGAMAGLPLVSLGLLMFGSRRTRRRS